MFFTYNFFSSKNKSNKTAILKKSKYCFYLIKLYERKFDFKNGASFEQKLVKNFKISLRKFDKT